MATIKLGIRELVEFVLRSGDLNPQTDASTNTALAGANIHRRLQKQRLKDYPDYQKEVGLKTTVTMNDQSYSIHGRADGIFKVDDQAHIEEIKTSDLVFEDVPESTLTLYWGQVKIYGYLLMKDQQRDHVTLQLTYYQTNEDKVTTQEQEWSFEESQRFFQSLIDEYESWLILRADMRTQRDQTIADLKFPYPAYRTGQHELAVATYKSIMLKKQMLVEAPTGTGKTISTLFPTIKAMREGLIQRTFYLTAKQSTRRVAEDALSLMATQGLSLKSITLTAKETITFPEEVDVAPADNPFMLGYYDRLKPALMDILTHEQQITRDVIETYAHKHTLDPFEFSLDVSLFCDVIVCDYNYLFDPLVYLQRFFSEPDEDNFFLIDEVHNLLSRAREMYSTSVEEQEIKDLKPLFKGDKGFHRHVNTLIKTFKALSSLLDDEQSDDLTIQPPLTSFVEELQHFNDFISDWLPKQEDGEELQKVLEAYFACLDYVRLSDNYGEEYRTRLFQTNRGLCVRLVCLDPSTFLNQSMHLGRGAVLFSATVTPLSYYQQVLGVDDDGIKYQLPSPFEPRHQAILVANYIQTTYRQRDANLTKILTSIHTLVAGKIGNYLIFFPSHGYLTTVVEAYRQAYPDERVIQQEPAMQSQDRDAFLAKFQPDATQSLVGFAVLGGIFSEGIDLPADRLIGVGIVSVGLPGLNVETDLIRDYFDGTNGHGFEYAYQLPGLNNVLQAAGRLIRSSHDQGIVLLMDQRFSQSRYSNLFPPHWRFWRGVNNVQALSACIDAFWKQTTLPQTKES
ncbi:helicase C-terminal domain-containing protein [Furfurilactobacillus milii]|uniref:ATP-dependent DNA helicase n=1 Tax=Furfurilactobacillus rossiae TaxID=231049 RepID=A0A7C9IVV3_9LACO|nr:ATP-dependent DNA helicase [Furfurilactobacillus milii]